MKLSYISCKQKQKMILYYRQVSNVLSAGKKGHRLSEVAEWSDNILT